MSLEKIRIKIERIDGQIVKLLTQRMKLSLLAKKSKKGIIDRKREKIVIKKAQIKSHGILGKDFVKKIFTEIIKESKRIQRNYKEV